MAVSIRDGHIFLTTVLSLMNYIHYDDLHNEKINSQNIDFCEFN